MSKRSEEVREEIRAEVRKDLNKHARISDSYKLARHVDDGLLTKTIENQYRSYTNNILRTVTTDDEAVEKNRNTYGSGFHRAEIPLEIPLAKIYFDAYGQGLDGSDCPSGVNEKYRCPFCGTRFEMTPKNMPEFCPCGHITPLGRLIQDGFYKRI